MSHNKISGGLKPLTGCIVLREVYMSQNQLKGGLEALMGCTTLRCIYMPANQLTATDDAKAHFEKQCQLFRI